MKGNLNDVDFSFSGALQGYLESAEHFGFFVVRDDKWDLPREFFRHLPSASGVAAGAGSPVLEGEQHEH